MSDQKIITGRSRVQNRVFNWARTKKKGVK